MAVTMLQEPLPERASLFSLSILFARVASSVFVHLVTYPFRPNPNPDLKSSLLNTAIRTLLTHITIPQSLTLNPSTTARYISFCTAHALTPTFLSAPYFSPDGIERKATAHWLGDPSAEKVILYLHGGAYFMPAPASTFLYLQHLVRKTNRKDKPVAALVMAYTLAPAAPFPTQVAETVVVLRALLAAGRHPKDIVLAGDSAGANIALGVLSHLLHPLDSVERLKLASPLGGALLLSPCATGSVDWESVRRNAGRDMLPGSKLRVWAAMYEGRVSGLQGEVPARKGGGDVYVEPVRAERGWWKGLDRVVEEVLVLSGGHEVLADAIAELGCRMGLGWVEGGGKEGRVRVVEMPRETHIGAITGFMRSGGKEAEGSQRVVEEWVGARLEV